MRVSAGPKTGSPLGCIFGSYIYMSKGFAYPFAENCKDIVEQLKNAKSSDDALTYEAAKYVVETLKEDGWDWLFLPNLIYIYRLEFATSLTLLFIYLLFVFFESPIRTENDIPDAKLRAEITTVMTMMKIVEIFVGTERKYLNGCPAEHIAAVSVVCVVYPED
jgi:hypothetical protein